MTNTYIAPGDATREEIIAGVDRGLYAVSFAGGQVEPATGDFVFGISEGYLIEGGRVTAPVRGATLIGNGIEVLSRIDAVGNDLAMKSGFCGKDGQQVPGRDRAADGADLGADRRRHRCLTTCEDAARLAVEEALAAGGDEADAWCEDCGRAQRARVRRRGREHDRGGQQGRRRACLPRAGAPAMPTAPT